MAETQARERQGAGLLAPFSGFAAKARPEKRQTTCGLNFAVISGGPAPLRVRFPLPAIKGKMASFEEEAAQLNIKSIVITMVLSALGFLVALAWRDAIQQTIDLLVPKGEGLSYTYIAAILVTVIAVIITFVLIKLQKVSLIPKEMKERFRKNADEKE